MKARAYGLVELLFLAVFLTVLKAPVASGELKIDSVYPTLGVLGAPLSITIKGSGFNEGTRVAMALDSGNLKSVKGGVDTPSFAYDVVISGNIAYVADGASGLQVVDISDPANPQIIAVENTPGTAFGIALSGTHAFIADGESGLQVIDISNPANPQRIGNGEDTPGEARAVTIEGTKAYIADYNGGLQVIDISNPSNPQIIGEKNIGHKANGVAVSGNYAYVAGEPFLTVANGSLSIVDISIPTNMAVVGSVDMPTFNVYNVTVTGDNAYIATRHLGIQVVDIINPANPQITQAVNTGGRSYSMTIAGDTGYVADDTAGISVLDMTDLENIQIIGTIDTPGDARSIVLKDELAYVADGDDGLRVVDIHSPNTQQVISWIPTPGVSQFFDAEDDKIYLGDGEGGMQVIDISDINTPTIIGSVPTNHRARDVAVVGNIAFVADTRGGLQVVDISDPTDPQIIGSYNQLLDPDIEDHWSRFVTVDTDKDGNPAYAYIVDYGNVLILDVSIPTAPTFIKEVPMPGYADGRIAIKNGYAYAPDKSNGSVSVIDARVPASASIVKTIDMPGSSAVGAKWVTIQGNYAYVANGDDGLCVLDISDPDNPSIAGSLALDDRAHSLIISGDTAYVANGDIGVTAVDISNPADMWVTGIADTTGGAVCLYVKDDVVFVSDFGNGCIVVPLPDGVKPVTFIPPNKLSCTLPSPSMAGDYTLQVFNNSGDLFNPDCALPGAVTFSESIKNSKAIIIAGGNYCLNQDQKLEEKFQEVANDAYKALLFQGFLKEDIMYVGPDTGIDPDDIGGADDVDAVNSSVNISSAFTSWAVSQSPQDIFVYLVGHGSTGYYKPNCDRFSADDVKAWITGLKAVATGNVVLIYDACQSGAFLLNMDESVGDSPVVITSAKSTQESWFYVRGNSLISFSSGFWRSVLSRSGAKLDEAFSNGKDMMKDLQTALMDANGDLLPNTPDDHTEIIIVGRGYQPDKGLPEIGSVSENLSLDTETSANIWANGITVTMGTLIEVFALITPPCYNAQNRSTPGTEDDVDQLTLLDGNVDGVFEGTYTGFTESGTYKVAIFARDSEGNVSEPKEFYVYKSAGLDEYEIDNSFTQATLVTLNDTQSQCHNFFEPGDEDWLSFFGVAGQIYLVEASNLGPGNNVIIEIYDTDGTTLLVSKDDQDDPRADESLYWQFAEDGLYYVRVRPADAGISGEETDYRLEIYRPVAEIFGYIAGTVKDMQGSPVENVAIKTDIGASGVSKDGSYFMVHRQGGPYLMTIDANGYQEKNITNINVDEDHTTFVHVQMEPTNVDTNPQVTILSPATSVTINEGESVNFQASVTDGNAPFSYAWNFDGGAANMATEDPGDVTFANQGVYSVSITVTDADGDDDSASVTVTVNKIIGPSVPNITITSPATNVTIKQGGAVNFQASLSQGNAPFTYAWDFDGGATDVAVEDPGDVTFLTPGIYTVQVTVTDGDGDSDSALVTITVEVDSKPIVSIQSPASDVSIDKGDAVNFQGLVTGGDLPLSYLWDFGGGAANVTVEDPGLVVFSNSGTFTVTFTAEDNDGDTDSATVVITVIGGGGGGGGCFVQSIM